jgi:mannan endo-1,4-beta-mannosidase
MSAFVKALDPNHLVSVGDEGFLNVGGEHWTYRGADGVDHAALTALPDVDFGTFHLYPDDWSTPPELAERWIADHVRLARQLGKPTILEEYGLKLDRARGRRDAASPGFRRRRDAYRSWNDALLAAGGNASLAWMLASNDERGARYPDYDHFAFYRDDPSGKLIGQFADAFERAPACRDPAPTAGLLPRSAFVSVTPPKPGIAAAWLTTD